MQANQSMSPQAQANTAYIKSQTAGQDITNAGNQLSLDFRRQFLNGMDSGQAPPAPNGNAALDGAMTLDAAHARAYVQQRFQPVPDIWLPQEQQQRLMAMASGIPGAADIVKAQHDARIQNARQQQQYDATQLYSHLYGVANAPDGQALNVLSVGEPDTADRFEQAGMTDAQARQHAADLAGIVHSVSQLPVKFRDDGVAVDGRTEEEIPGYDSAVGMSAKDRAGLITELNKPVKVAGTEPGTETTVPTWQATQQYSSLEDAVRKTTNMANIHRVPGPAVAPAVAAARNPAPAPASPPPPQAPGAAAAPGAPGASPQAFSTATPAQVAQAALARMPPAQRAAYTDQDYQLPPQPPGKLGTSAPPEVVDERKAITKARTDLLGEQSLNTAAAGQALRYYKLADDILSTGNVTTGWSADHIAQVSAALTQLGINPKWLGDPSKAAVLTKNLTNAGLQDLRAKFGSKIAQSEVFLNLNKASPNIDMPAPALHEVIKEQVDNMNYAIQSGQRMNQYLATGNDPRKFDAWNQQYFPRQNAGSSAGAGAGTKIATPYDTPAKIKAAVQSNALSRADGLKLLRANHGMQ